MKQAKDSDIVLSVLDVARIANALGVTIPLHAPDSSVATILLGAAEALSRHPAIRWQQTYLDQLLSHLTANPDHYTIIAAVHPDDQNGGHTWTIADEAATEEYSSLAGLVEALPEVTKRFEETEDPLADPETRAALTSEGARALRNRKLEVIRKHVTQALEDAMRAADEPCSVAENRLIDAVRELADAVSVSAGLSFGVGPRSNRLPTITEG